MHDPNASGEAPDATDTMPRPAPPASRQLEADAARVQIARRLFGVTMEAPRLGRFRVLERLGVGGMGEVFAAFDTVLDRRIAIKVLREATASTDEHVRLQREAQAMARLSHPNVVQIYEVGEHEGRIFIAMEFVDGCTLTHWLAREPQAWQDIVAVFEQAGRGLHAAHVAGIVHRDFKPDNVLVGSDGRVRVADFGLAHDAGRHTPGGDITTSNATLLASPLTRRGARIGTPVYMSPEQHDGAATDPRSDQFSFCVALYEALYGHRPFGGIDVAELSVAVHSGVPEPPAGTRVPAWVFRAVATGLSPNPGHRHGSMEVLLAELARDPPGKRDPWRWLAAALAILLALGGVGILVFDRERQASPIELAAVARRVAQAQDAAARSHWVYPPASDPHDTAILRILEIETLRGPIEVRALALAADLRTTIADELAEIGDVYWNAARPYARDFYAQALMFRPDHPRARERGGFTPGEVAELRDKASRATFSAAELTAVEPLLVLASRDPAERARWLREYEQTTAHAPGETPTPAPAPLVPPAPAPLVSPAPAPLVPPAPLVSPHAPSAPRITPEVPPTPGFTATPTAEDPSRAAQLVREAEAARQRGAPAEARRLYNQAIAAHPRCAAALGGLSDLAFDEGDYGKAVDFGERTVNIADDNAGYHLRLGDAYFKVMRYSDARRAYEAAAALGHPRAQERLGKLESKLGAP